MVHSVVEVGQMTNGSTMLYDSQCMIKVVLMNVAMILVVVQVLYHS